MVRQMMAKKPEDRYQTPVEVVAALTSAFAPDSRASCFRAAMDGITTAVIGEADAHRGRGNEGPAHRIRRCVVANVDNLEAACCTWKSA